MKSLACQSTRSSCLSKHSLLCSASKAKKVDSLLTRRASVTKVEEKLVEGEMRNLCQQSTDKLRGIHFFAFTACARAELTLELRKRGPQGWISTSANCVAVLHKARFCQRGVTTTRMATGYSETLRLLSVWRSLVCRSQDLLDFWCRGYARHCVRNMLISMIAEIMPTPELRQPDKPLP
jgi:hypothetical protein